MAICAFYVPHLSSSPVGAPVCRIHICTVIQKTEPGKKFFGGPMTLTSRGVRTANCLKQLTRKQIDSIDPRQKMLRFFCCCCFSSENSDDERQPLLQPRPSDLTGAESARQTRPAHSDAQVDRKRIGRLVMRRVCVPELDQRFSELAETFNEQHERHEAMVRHIRNVRQIYGCNHNDSLALAECVGKIREEHEAKYRVSLKLKGYDFSLNVVPVESEGENEEEPLPPHLQLAKDELQGASENAKATISKGTTLQELIGWLLHSRDQMAGQVRGAAATYQEQGRLNENLEENMNEVRRANELALGYRQHAGGVHTEVAQIAGAYL